METPKPSMFAFLAKKQKEDIDSTIFETRCICCKKPLGIVFASGKQLKIWMMCKKCHKLNYPEKYGGKP